MAIVSQPHRAGSVDRPAHSDGSSYTVERRCDERLREELEAARRGVRRSRATTLAATGCAALGIGVLTLAACDYQLEATWSVRALLLAVVAASTAGAGVLRWLNWGARFSLAQAAALVESRQTSVGQRLRTALDYDQGRPEPSPASPALLDALEQETNRASQSIAWGQVVDRKAARYALAAAMLVWGAGAASVAAGPEWRTALARTLLAPLEYTTVTFKPREATIRAGESVTVEVEISGRPLREASLRYSTDSTTWRELPLLPPETPVEDRPERLVGQLETTLVELQEDTHFEVLAGPIEQPRGFVRVLQPLELTQLTAAVAPPEYTRLPPETLSGRELRVREGSRVELRVEFNRSAALVKLADRESNAPETTESSATESENGGQGNATPRSPLTPLTPAPGTNAKEFIAVLEDVRENRTLELSGNAADGMQLSPVTISIRVILDRKPKLEFVEPPEQLEVLPTTEVPMKVAAQDDLALLKVGIMAQLGDQPMQVLVEQTVDRTQDPVELLTTLMLENQPLTHQHGVTYHAFAEDDYFGAPRRVTTPLRFIDIRPYQREFQRKEGGNCSSCNSTTLEELIARQRKNLSQTFVLRDQSVRPNDRERLATNEREIQAATEELTTGLAERGVFVPELPEAVQAMKQATASLESGDMSAASDLQQTALSKLLHARQNLRKVISECNSQQQSECQKFDQQQRQKLRTPEQKKEEQEQKVGQARKELEQLAKQQRKWSEEVRSQCQNSSSSSSQSKSQSQSQSKSQSQSQSQSKPESQSQSQSQPQSQSEATQQSGKSPEQLAQEQQKMLEQLASLREQLEQAGANSEAGREQGRQASESMKSGLEQLQQEQGEQAAAEGERSAEQLEQLADHLHALQSSDLAGRLDQARQMAEQIARRQAEQANAAGGETRNRETGERGQPAAGKTEAGAENESDEKGASEKPAKPAGSASGRGRADGTPAERRAWAQAERDLAQQADLLGERLSSLRADASGEKAGMAERLEAVNQEQSPAQLGAALRRAADDAQSGRADAAREGARQAQADAERLAKALGGLRQELAQPQLQELMKLEEQLAAFERQLSRQREQGEPGTAGERWSQLAPQLESLAKGDRRLAEAIQRMAHAARQPGSNAGPGEHRDEASEMLPPGFYSWSQLAEFARVNEVTKVVQMKIQEAILAGALQESDEPVPPEFRSLVDEYYRALSDDLSP